MEKALFGAGCFWGVEEKFRNINGVQSTEVGYTGGDTQNPTYEEVCVGDTNHAEVVLIHFDKSKVTYDELLDHFWKCHDPTTLNRQGPDVGTQYRSVIFYFSESQKKASNSSKDNYAKNNNLNIVTEIKEAREYFKAEEYHQKYIKKTGLFCAS